jgi:hypothetical protein
MERPSAPSATTAVGAETAARCPFCDAQPGQAVTATERQALAHAEHVEDAESERLERKIVPEGGGQWSRVGDTDYG